MNEVHQVTDGGADDNQPAVKVINADGKPTAIGGWKAFDKEHANTLRITAFHCWRKTGNSKRTLPTP